MTTRVPSYMAGVPGTVGNGTTDDGALADEVDEASEVTAGPFVDLKHGAPAWRDRLRRPV